MILDSMRNELIAHAHVEKLYQRQRTVASLNMYYYNSKNLEIKEADIIYKNVHRLNCMECLCVNVLSSDSTEGSGILALVQV